MRLTETMELMFVCVQAGESERQQDREIERKGTQAKIDKRLRRTTANTSTYTSAANRLYTRKSE